MRNSFSGRDPINSFSSIVLFSCFFLLLTTAVLVVPAQTVPPVLDLRFIGNGTVTAMNNAGTIVGYKTVGSTFEPLVSIDGQPFESLPAPAGAMTTFPTDINNNGVIVGVSYSPQWVAVAVRWTPAPNGYVLQVLPRINNDPTSFATAINDVGQIVGSRSNLGYQPSGQGWVYSDSAGFTALSTFGFWIVPRDINNSGIIVGGQERLNLATGQVDVTGQGPSNYNDITSTAINASGMIAGSSTLRSTSLNIVAVFRRGLDGIWTFIAGTSRWTKVQSINSLGDIGYGELGAGVYLDGLGTFPVWSLLDPTVTAAGWTITGSGAFINDSRQVVTIGSNTVSGENGVVLLSPTGTLPPPTAPTALFGIAHPATRMEPYNSIDLTWANTSSLTNGYELQRSAAGINQWISLSLTPPGTATQHSDTTVGVNITYDYRIRALGIGGPSLWSNIATVTSPPTPLDTTPPVATLLEPTNGATVSGIVPVRAVATDNVAVEYQEISFWNQYTAQEVVIVSAPGGGELSGNWDTRLLTPATYRVRAFAYDTMGNWHQSEANVVVTSPAPVTMRVSQINLTATGSGLVTVNGLVTVIDSTGLPVSGASVSIVWSTPDGRHRSQVRQTNGLGVASFSVTSIPGTYQLGVLHVMKSGTRFIRSTSQLTATINAP